MSDTSKETEVKHEVARVEKPGTDVVVREPTDDPDYFEIVWDNGNAHPAMCLTHRDTGYDVLEALADYYGAELDWGFNDDE